MTTRKQLTLLQELSIDIYGLIDELFLFKKIHNIFKFFIVI